MVHCSFYKIQSQTTWSSALKSPVLVLNLDIPGAYPPAAQKYPVSLEKQIRHGNEFER